MQEIRLQIAWRYWGHRKVWQLLSLATVCGLCGIAYAEQAPISDTTVGGPRPLKRQWIPKGGEFSVAVPDMPGPDRLLKKKSVTRQRHIRNTPSATWLPKGAEFAATFGQQPAYNRRRIASAHQTLHKQRPNGSRTKGATTRRTTDEQQHSLAKKNGQQFFRYPLRFTRISSEFSHARFHPILKRTRPHLGVDFAAPRGTPVRAVADGVVQYAGWRGGLGRFVRLDHPGPYGSGYGHLYRIAKGVRGGGRVKQGQIIGYVGSTGLATGPHLHFVMYKYGKHINPLRKQFWKQVPRTRRPVRQTKPVQRQQLTQIRLP